MKLLFIGNSHTYVNDMPQTVKLNATKEIEVTMIARPGITFQDHLNDPTFHFMIKQPFDAVIIQQAAHSPCPSKEETLRDGKLIIEEARENGQNIYVLIPWSHKGYLDKHEEIQDIYATLVEETGIAGINAGNVIKALWDQLDLFYKDDEHMSPLGSYVEACCILKKALNQDEFKGVMIDSGFTSRAFHEASVKESEKQLIEQTIEEIL